jgi:hypothetical protein
VDREDGKEQLDSWRSNTRIFIVQFWWDRMGFVMPEFSDEDVEVNTRWVLSRRRWIID